VNYKAKVLLVKLGNIQLAYYVLWSMSALQHTAANHQECYMSVRIVDTLVIRLIIIIRLGVEARQR